MTRFIFALFLMAICVVSTNAQAQDYMLIEVLTQKNRLDPMQYPYYEPIERVIDRTVLDNSNKTVGEVRDVIINTNGSISSLGVEFDRLQMPGTVPISYSEMIDRPADDAYYMRVNDDFLSERYPEILANIATAAGASDQISVKSLIGAPVESLDGRRLGKVENVLFSDNGGRVDSLYIKLSLGMFRGDTIAIPVNVVDFVNKDSRMKKTVMLTKLEADAVLTVAEDLD